MNFQHNWDDAGAYPVTLIYDAPDAFAGVAFHCYEGNVDNQDVFHNAEPSKDVYLTECTGTLGSDWWGDIKWYMDNLWIGALEHNAKSGLMWNIALDASKAIIPKDSGGPFGKRIHVSVTGSLGWTLRAGAYITRRKKSYPAGSWSPTPVTASISFRGMQVS
ncbi:hypothetical protein F5877DRAFT_93818 [Lentinula edodes]|nr:hypothetical protein F5877DRAFT_93818 [Lentinula edodes]